MIVSKPVSNHLPRVSEFYHGKSIFITGASGFLGSILLEVLLRCCPGIKTIYILLRAKRKVNPENRKERIFNKKIFENMRINTPELLQKVYVVSGDISTNNLGLNDIDRHLLLQEVSIVFHCAAVISFDKPMEFMLKNNVLSVRSVIDLCRKMRKFEVLVYTSTAFSNSNHCMAPLGEEIYRLPFNAKHFIDALINEDKEKLHKLVSHCKPDWPNWYTFSKCLSENLIADTASDLPVAIIRPSLIFSTLKYPIPGYLETQSGAVAILIGVGKGLLKVFNGNPEAKQSFVPVDVTANAHVLAACSIGTRRYPSTLVLNCTASESLTISLANYINIVAQVAIKNPFPQSFDKPPNTIIVQNRYLYSIIRFYNHYLPAWILHCILKILRKEINIVDTYRFLDKVTNEVFYFSTHGFEFVRTNFKNLDKLTHPKDKKDLSLDMESSTFLKLALSIPEASEFYDWKIDNKSKQERERATHKIHILINCIQWAFLIICSLFVSCLFYFIFY